MSKMKNATQKVAVGRLTITSPAGRSAPANCGCIQPRADVSSGRR
ncbi:hypothetical protein [Mycolicibacterium novocastrense]|nr:hypothetical protein [Mycolicibacterium novocastrense]